MKDVPLWINITYSIVYMIASFYSIIQVVKLAFRIKSARKQFLIVIPLLWLLTSIDKYYAYNNIYNEFPTHIYVILSSIIYGIHWGCFFLFYSNKRVKRFLSSIG